EGPLDSPSCPSIHVPVASQLAIAQAGIRVALDRMACRSRARLCVAPVSYASALFICRISGRQVRRTWSSRYIMRVSVIVPAYNRGYIIAEALQSVFAQAFQDFELIVVDDGSKDDTAQVVSGFSEPRLRYVRHEQNRGYSAACNTGLREASGEYTGFLDSDDIWKPEMLSRDVSFLDRHPEADAVF